MKLLIAILVSIFFTSCRFNGNFDGIKGSGNVITEPRTITETFENIEVGDGIELIVEQSSEKAVVVEADDNITSHILTRVENGKLIIESDHSYNTENNPRVTVKLPIISRLTATGGSNIDTNGKLITEKILVDAAGGSRVNIEVEADFISIEATDGSSAEVSGKALKLETSSSGGSQINARDLSANVVHSESSGGSSTSVDAIVKLNANASSGSSVDYKNTPKELTKEESSGGSIHNN